MPRATTPSSDPAAILVAGFYRFVELPHRAELAERIREAATKRRLVGTVLLATEGINGTLAGEPGDLRSVLELLRSIPELEGLRAQESWATAPPFHRLRVRLKKEIISLGVPDLEASTSAPHVDPARWNELVDDPTVLKLDVRNDYETAIGGFVGALDPGTRNFHDLPQRLDELELETRGPVAMYCTGGIRCEKAATVLAQRGFGPIYQLKGGILAYLEEVPPSESRWRGECFVFDQRVAVGQGLELGQHELCFACRWPISTEDKTKEGFRQGVSCPRCHGSWSEEQIQRFEERQLQMDLAEARSTTHLGPRAQPDAADSERAALDG